MTQTIKLPSVDRLLLQLSSSIAEHGHQIVTAFIRAELAAAREGAQGGLTIPDEAELAELHRRVGWQRLLFQPQQHRLLQPGQAWLDLSAIAKGHAADLVARQATEWAPIIKAADLK